MSNGILLVTLVVLMALSVEGLKVQMFKEGNINWMQGDNSNAVKSAAGTTCTIPGRSAMDCPYENAYCCYNTAHCCQKGFSCQETMGGTARCVRRCKGKNEGTVRFCEGKFVKQVDAAPQKAAAQQQAPAQAAAQQAAAPAAAQRVAAAQAASAIPTKGTLVVLNNSNKVKHRTVSK